MKDITSKWADIADPDNETMKKQVSSFSNSSGLTSSKSIEQFIDRIEELESKHSINALEVIAYVLSPLLGREQSTDDAAPEFAIVGEGVLGGKSREQVISICNKHGLRTLPQLLLLIDKLQQAQKGTLFKNQ